MTAEEKLKELLEEIILPYPAVSVLVTRKTVPHIVKEIVARFDRPNIGVPQ